MGNKFKVRGQSNTDNILKALYLIKCGIDPSVLTFIKTNIITHEEQNVTMAQKSSTQCQCSYFHIFKKVSFVDNQAWGTKCINYLQ